MITEEKKQNKNDIKGKHLIAVTNVDKNIDKNVFTKANKTAVRLKAKLHYWHLGLFNDLIFVCVAYCELQQFNRMTLKQLNWNSCSPH